MEFLEVSSKFISQYSFSHLMKMGDTSSDSDGIKPIINIQVITSITKI